MTQALDALAVVACLLILAWMIGSFGSLFAEAVPMEYMQ